MKHLLILLLLPIQLLAQTGSPDLDRWQKQAKNVTIIRDHFGIPHIYGKTDADAVFGLMYAQCEDDFNRIEMNYLEKLGWLSRIKGESELYNDLLVRMIIDQEEAEADYARSPQWLKKLCDAWADAINYYVFKHAELDNHVGEYEPWFPFLWTDGSIGAINTAGMGAGQLKDLYGERGANGSNTSYRSNEEVVEVLTGSNGFAFSPKITVSKKSILYINPHVTFYFRPEVHMVSEEGLNVYGAVTWGQFFIYQGFNQHCGWMHTSSGVDAADAYSEKIVEKNGKQFYTYNKTERPVKKKKIIINYKTSSGEIQSKTFDVMYTHHGPVMGKRNGDYISVRADNRLANGLIQCWQRTKANSFAAFKKTLDLKGNISNNTVYADAEGNIAYWHGNRIPKRDPKIDWSKPVDGTNPATEWKGYHPITETIYSINPPNGWLQNCNSTPFTVAGKNSPKKFTASGGENYPAYMAPDGENFRGINAVRVLSEKNNYTIDKVIDAGYDRRLSLFEVLIPALIKAYEESNSKTEFSYLSQPILTMKKWDYRCDTNSVATTLAVHFGEKLQRAVNLVKVPGIERPDIVDKVRQYAVEAKPDELLKSFSDMVDTLKKKHGNWNIPWGEINRFQRLSGEIENKFDDSQPSIPVGFVSSAWGMLPSYSSRSFPSTTKRYGVNGNSFICAVEFGKKIKAKSLLAGGQSGNPNSPHFFDQGSMFSKGEFKDVLFYKEDVLKNAKKRYHPGE